MKTKRRDISAGTRLGDFSALIVAAFLLAAVTGCTPQAYYVNVDVKDDGFVELPIEDNNLSLFAITSQNSSDSLRLSNVAVGIAEKLEQDREWAKGRIPVYSIPKEEFMGFPSELNRIEGGTDTTYLHTLMVESGSRMLLFVDNLRFYDYGVQKNASNTGYDNVNVILPYSVELNIYDAVDDSLLYNLVERDSVYVQVLSSVANGGELGTAVAGYLPQIARKIGEKMGALFTVQWITQERMVICYDGSPDWESALLFAQDFKWREAIELWMPFAESENPKKAAFAAFNIAVGCEILEEPELALKWSTFALKKYKFAELANLHNYLLKAVKEKKSL